MLKCKHNKAKQPHSRHIQSEDVNALNRNKERTEPLLITPICSETRLRHSLISMIEDLHLESGWCAFTPSRLGESRPADSAARALTIAHIGMRQQNDSLLDGAYREYVKSLEQLRSSIDLSDGTLMTVALLFLFESLMRERVSACVLHQEAINDILLARPKTQPISEFARSLLYTSNGSPFRTSVASGTASPFDDPRWLQLKPVNRTETLITEVSRLMQLSFQTFLRLPRLMACVRSLRNEAGQASITSTLELAQQLMLLGDADAESKLLHRVHIDVRNMLEGTLLLNPITDLANSQTALSLTRLGKLETPFKDLRDGYRPFHMLRCLH